MAADLTSERDAEDRRAVTRLLGREPNGDFDVAVRSSDGDPVVIRNSPLLEDGRPMPTRFWLVDRKLSEAVSRLESTGAVRRAEAETDPEELARAHAVYAAERDAAVLEDHEGPRPYGGVGGTRRGSSASTPISLGTWQEETTPVGRWTAEQIGLNP